MQKSFEINYKSKVLKGIGNLQNINDKNCFFCLHGWLDNAASFQPLMEVFGNEVSLIAMDLVGHGDSFHLDAEAHYHMLDHIHLLEWLRKELKIEKYRFLCHSLGGVIAGVYAGVYPENVEVVFSIEALGPISAAPEVAPESLRRYSDRLLLLEKKQKRKHESFASCLKARMRNNDISEKAARILSTRGAKQIGEHYVWKTDSRLTVPSSLRMTEEQVKAVFENIDCPYHLFVADEGIGLVREALKKRTTYVKDLRIHKVSGDHHCHMDYPDEIASVVQGYLKT